MLPPGDILWPRSKKIKYITNPIHFEGAGILLTRLSALACPEILLTRKATEDRWSIFSGSFLASDHVFFVTALRQAREKTDFLGKGQYFDLLEMSIEDQPLEIREFKLLRNYYHFEVYLASIKNDVLDWPSSDTNQSLLSWFSIDNLPHKLTKEAKRALKKYNCHLSRSALLCENTIMGHLSKAS